MTGIWETLVQKWPNDKKVRIFLTKVSLQLFFLMFGLTHQLDKDFYKWFYPEKLCRTGFSMWVIEFRLDFEIFRRFINEFCIQFPPNSSANGSKPIIHPPVWNDEWYVFFPKHKMVDKNSCWRNSQNRFGLVFQQIWIRFSEKQISAITLHFVVW